jgi:CheY-like chemotaxis protein
MARLLLVEDRDLRKQLLVSTVEMLFDTIDWVDSSEEALEKLKMADATGQLYECLILDLNIWDFKGGTDGGRRISDERSPHHGIKVLEACIAAYKERLIILSAYVSEVQTQLTALGSLELVMPYPVPSNLLRERVQEILARAARTAQ